MSGDSWTRLETAEVAPEFGWSRAARSQAEGDRVGKGLLDRRSRVGDSLGGPCLAGKLIMSSIRWSPPELLIMTMARLPSPRRGWEAEPQHHPAPKFGGQAV